MGTIQFLCRRTMDGEPRSLLRVFDPRTVDSRAEMWTPEGWKPAGLEWTGIGGPADEE